MAYFNILLFIFIVVIFAFFYSKNEQNKNQTTFENRDKKNHILKEEEKGKIEKTTLTLPLFNSKEEKIEENIEKNNFLDIKKEENLENSSLKKDENFKTTKDFFDKFFPDLEEEFGEDIKYFFLKSSTVRVMTGLKKSPLTDEQKKLFHSLRADESSEFQGTTPVHFLSLEEEIELEENLNIIRDKYIPLFMNILTSEQKEEAVYLYNKKIVSHLREMKNNGENLQLDRIKELKKQLNEK
jgi:hypothetical protein